MKILVTGGGGFLGQAVVRLLLNGGHRVAILNRSACSDLESLGVECLRGDLADRETVFGACRGRDAVIHVGARAGPGLFRPAFERPNVVGTQNVIDSCRSHAVGFLIYTSSPSVVHSGRDLAGADESTPYPTHFPAPYPATKAEAEKRVLAANGRSLKTTALRPHLIWGPGDNHLLPRLVQRNRSGRLRLPCPDKKIDTVYIDNAAEAHVLALDNLAGSATAAGNAYFISNGEPLAVAEIMRRLLEAAGEVPQIGR
ncbi:MAG: NAD-dependent epimerase/dehydratase family protein, partial [Xanthomonadaceae bacterium]|nr:NAD-dependent epimerase/dehydratase family protein [Xanthomonadaceae bacterium]